MSEFLYLYRGGDRQPTPEGMQQQMQRWMAWMKDLSDKGHIKNPGHPLELTGKVVSGKTVTDGPFAEKDMVGGYTLVEAANIVEAVELSRGCPILAMNGHVEVRPIMKMNM
jgi:hypothetical protein